MWRIQDYLHGVGGEPLLIIYREKITSRFGRYGISPKGKGYLGATPRKISFIAFVCLTYFCNVLQKSVFVLRAGPSPSGFTTVSEKRD